MSLKGSDLGAGLLSGCIAPHDASPDSSPGTWICPTCNTVVRHPVRDRKRILRCSFGGHAVFKRSFFLRVVLLGSFAGALYYLVTYYAAIIEFMEAYFLALRLLAPLYVVLQLSVGWIYAARPQPAKRIGINKILQAVSFSIGMALTSILLLPHAFSFSNETLEQIIFNHYER